MRPYWVWRPPRSAAADCGSSAEGGGATRLQRSATHVVMTYSRYICIPQRTVKITCKKWRSYFLSVESAGSALCFCSYARMYFALIHWGLYHLSMSFRSL